MSKFACSLALLAGVFAPRSASPAEAPFVRGDCNADGDAACQVTDPIFLLGHLFTGGKAPPCLEACNANDDDGVDISDAVYFLLHCFAGGPPPPAPFPDCGTDPTPSFACDDFPPCAGACAPQDARGVGPCAAIVGIFWDGYRCSYHSGCSCEGKDCSNGFDSIEECYAAHDACETPCDPMTAKGIGDCKKLLGWSWNGRECRLLGGCECEGDDCGRLYASEDECAASVSGCPALCTPMDVHEVGTCERVLGWSWDGQDCKSLSGCECEGTDCDKLFVSPDDCLAAHARCE